MNEFLREITMFVRILVLCISTALLSGCPFLTLWDEKICENTLSKCDQPIFLSWEDRDQQPIVHYGSTEALVLAGNIYRQDDLLIVNELYRGYHLYSLADAQNPIQLAFIELAGAEQLTVKNDVLYANSAERLYSISLEDVLSGQFNESSSEWIKVGNNKDIFILQNIFVDGARFRKLVITEDDNYDLVPYVAEDGYEFHPFWINDRGLLIGYETQAGEQYLYGATNETDP